MPVDIESCAVYFDGFGLLSEYEDTIQFTGTKLAENNLAALGEIEAKWEELFDKAEEMFYQYSSNVDMEQNKCAQAKQPDPENILTGLDAVIDKPGSGQVQSPPNQSPTKESLGIITESEGMASTSSGERDDGKALPQQQANTIASDQERAAIVQNCNEDLQKILDDINREARKSLMAMDFDYDCSQRVKNHNVTVKALLDKMITILRNVDPIKDLNPKLRDTLLSWSKNNITSQGNLITKADEIKDLKVPEITGNIAASKYGGRLRKQQEKIINMKKVYEICTPVFKAIQERFTAINKLVGGDGLPKQKAKSDKYDDYEKSLLNKTRQKLRKLK